MITVIWFVSFLLIPCFILAIVYYTFRMWYFKRKYHDIYQDEPIYLAMKKRRKISAHALPVALVAFVAFTFLENSEQKEKEEKRILAKVESFTGEDKDLFDLKFSEFKKSMKEQKAREKAAMIVEKNAENNKRISNLDGEDKAFYIQKFNDYKNSMSEFDAKDKALNELDIEIDRRNKELQKKYDDQAKYEEWITWQKQEKEKEEAAELQKKYDDQAKYEEWIAWQKQEKEKAEAAELQKKYDDQAKYEEWIAWQKAEEEKRLAEEEKNRPLVTSAYEMLSLFDGNRDAAKEQYQGKRVHINNCVIEFIGNNAILCNYKIDYKSSSSSILIENPRVLSNYMQLRKDDVINITGTIKSVNVVVGNSTFGDVYGYIVHIE